MRGNGSKLFTKTIYDPSIWTDAKLKKAVKESVEDALKQNGSFINGKSYKGVTEEGYSIEFWYRDDLIQTFYFL